MKIYTMYSVKIKHYSHIFKPTVKIYRHAVDFYMEKDKQYFYLLEGRKLCEQLYYH